ncbi:MAG: YraN family protein [Dysgonamonadaceae bacterium]|jgi:putative endonuclease|nr:YraN family protein [Dysgonamonadaceae bacterium]
MARHNELGKEGEAAALEYLKKNGYEILHTNWRRGHLELDIVARTDCELVFVEVKTRSAGGVTDPGDAVNNQKIRNIVDAADCYIKSFDTDLPARFDIITLVGREPCFETEHVADAFRAPLTGVR